MSSANNGKGHVGVHINSLKRLKIIVVANPVTMQLVLLDQPSTFLGLKLDEVSIWISEKDERAD
jgi:hypothetical protein